MDAHGIFVSSSDERRATLCSIQKPNVTLYNVIPSQIVSSQSYSSMPKLLLYFDFEYQNQTARKIGIHLPQPQFPTSLHKIFLKPTSLKLKIITANGSQSLSSSSKSTKIIHKNLQTTAHPLTPTYLPRI